MLESLTLFFITASILLLRTCIGLIFNFLDKLCSSNFDELKLLFIDIVNVLFLPTFKPILAKPNI